MKYSLGDKIITKKKHPCGSDEWEITRIGADFKIKCLKCNHQVLIDSISMDKIVKKHLPKTEESEI